MVRRSATRDVMRSSSKALAAAADYLRPPRRGIVVLLYHRVGEQRGAQMELPAALFARHVHRLHQGGRVIDLPSALGSLERASEPETDPVVLTFDDGTADFVDTILPLLVEHDVPATLYLATDYIERQIPFPHNGKPLSWAAVSDAVDTGLVTVGSHTHTHALLDRVTTKEAETELRRSASLIEDRLGIRAEHFAYPKAVPGSASADSLVRRRFRSAALAGTRPNRYGRTDLHRLARSPIQNADGLRWFERKLHGGMRLEDDIRRLLNRRRYSDATS